MATGKIMQVIAERRKEIQIEIEKLNLQLSALNLEDRELQITAITVQRLDAGNEK